MNGKTPIPPTARCSEFWDALAPYHASIEDNYLDLATTRRILPELQGPVLVVGAGQGLIVEEIRKAGLPCHGIDLSREMIRYARLRRGIDLIHADARAMPIAEESFATVIFATGVIDFTEDETAIRVMLDEARRVVRKSGKIFVAFYRLSPASERFMSTIGLLKNNLLTLRPTFELYLLNPFQTVSWVARRADLSYLNAALLLLRMSLLTSVAEKRMSLRMRKMFRKMENPQSLLAASPERQPYRNPAAIRDLFGRLAIQVKQLDVFAGCYVARVQ